jgi:hypothetical protein
MVRNGPLTPLQERREFFRLKYEVPVEFKAYSNAGSAKGPAANGVSQNISQSGILFQIDKEPPKISSILWMNLDIRTLKICQEIERRAIVLNNGVLGRVVRVEEDAQNNHVYDIGVCFLTQDQKNSREVQEILSEFNQAV